MDVRLGRGPFWTQGGLLMGATLRECRVVLGQCAIFRDLIPLYPSLTKSGLYLEWKGLPKRTTRAGTVNNR